MSGWQETSQDEALAGPCMTSGVEADPLKLSIELRHGLSQEELTTLNS
jgi:hypothetical protein